MENYILFNIPSEYYSQIIESLKPISWPALFNEYQSKLYSYETALRFGNYPIPLTVNNCYEGDTYTNEEQFPLLPFTLKRNYASILLSNMASLRQNLTNESHCKNEYAACWHMNESEKIEFDQTGAILDKFQFLIFQHSANQYQSSNISNEELPPTQHIKPIEFILNHDTTKNISPSITSKNQSEEIEENNSTSFSITGLIKFLWWVLWCYCALWTLAYFSVHWGNIFIIIIALFYALYKALKVKIPQSN